MKKITLPITVALIVILLMSSCDSIKCTLGSKAEPDGLVKGDNAVKMQDNYLVENKNRYMNSEQRQGISSDMRSFLRDRRSERNFELANEEGIDNTNIRFTLDNLQQYICYIVREFEKLPEEYVLIKYGIDPNNYTFEDLGVRIYFAAKEVDGNMRSTVFLVPVVKGIQDEYNDIREIEPLNFGHARRPPGSRLYEGYINPEEINYGNF